MTPRRDNSQRSSLPFANHQPIFPLNQSSLLGIIAPIGLHRRLPPHRSLIALFLVSPIIDSNEGVRNISKDSFLFPRQIAPQLGLTKGLSNGCWLKTSPTYTKNPHAFLIQTKTTSYDNDTVSLFISDLFSQRKEVQPPLHLVTIESKSD